MKRRIWIALIVLAQIAVLFGMAAQREWILTHAPTVRLRTAPVDPNDPMRGAYSQLRYELNRVPSSLCRDGLKDWFKGVDSADYRRSQRYRDRLVYASLETDSAGVTQLVGLSDQKPAAGRFLRGRVDSVFGDRLHVRYGIEAYFSEKREALKWEEERQGSHRGVPLEVEVAVAQSGLAVLKSIRWEPLGLIARVLREPVSETRDGRTQTIQAPTGIELEIKNHSAEPVGIVARPGGRSFRLIYVGEEEPPAYIWVNRESATPPPSATDIRLLAPGESYRELLNMRDPYWNVEQVSPDKKEPKEVLSLDKIIGLSNAPFRFEYRPELGSEPLPHREQVRLPPLQSARWWANRGLD